MRYKNTKTQAVIETACEIHGGDWAKEETEETVKSPKKTQKSVVKKRE